MNPMIPSTRPTMASAPPPTMPPLVTMRCLEITPMIAAVGPTTIPRHPQLQTSKTIPPPSAALPRPSMSPSGRRRGRGPVRAAPYYPRLHRKRMSRGEKDSDAARNQAKRADEAGGDQHKAGDQSVGDVR